MRLLVVEDDVALGSLLERGLAEEGHSVELVGTVRDAEHRLAEDEVDLVVLDIGLPDGDGMSLCRRWREKGSQVPVLMLTARDELRDRVGGLDSGADDYLTKPFEFPELTARVRALLRRPPDTRPPVLTTGRLTIDPAAHEVRVDGVVVPLTPREFALMSVFVARIGDVVSRTELLDQVWDANYDGMSNVVDVHVAALRRKLESAGHPDPIATVRGVGYRFDGEAA
ncbi:MAG: response regulator transcription factor [Actinomycetota bacterium]